MTQSGLESTTLVGSHVIVVKCCSTAEARNDGFPVRGDPKDDSGRV